MRSGRALLFALLVALTIAAGAVLVFGARPSSGERERAQEFQRLVGGLGFGPARDLSRCEFSFDPRLGPACTEDTGSIPGGRAFCPYHACTIFDYPPLVSFPPSPPLRGRGGKIQRFQD